MSTLFWVSHGRELEFQMFSFIIILDSISVAIDLIVQHIRDLLSNRLNIDLLNLSATTSPALNGARGKNVSLNDPNYRPH
jgi:hypothetical protein